MKTLYFDCFAGASGDMIMGGLIGLGVDPCALTDALAGLGPKGWELIFSTVDRSGISANRVEVVIEAERAHRHLRDILEIIEDSDLTSGVKARAGTIFSRLAEAEARVHRIPVEKIHFHEVGALDAIIDIVGACIGFDMLGVERFMASALHVGSGFVEMAHGRFPVPPPAVTELLAGAPIYASDIVGELVTPTGAAIISTVCTEFGPIPPMTISATGYGAGGRSYEKFPNAIRLLLGQSAPAEPVPAERLVMLETNLDDLAPHVLGYVMERVFEAGALDCYFTHVQMKKNRPGVMLSVLCSRETRAGVERVLFSETTTLGLRIRDVDRVTLRRAIVPVSTEYGPIDVKVAEVDGGETKATPEFEQCRAAAIRYGVPLRQVEAAALRSYRDSLVESVVG